MANGLRRSQIITIHAVLSALILMFMILPIYFVSMVELAFIPLIAIILSVEILGLKHGIFTGAFFGVVSLVTAIMHPDILSRVFYNPLVSILPRIMIAPMVFICIRLTKRLFPKANALLCYSVGAAAGVITNTTLVLGMILLFHFGASFTAEGATVYIGWQWIAAILLGNFLIELLIVTIITPPITLAVKRYVLKGH